MKRDWYKREKWLRNNYCEKELSALEIARRCRVHKSSVYYWLEKYGIEVRSSLESRKRQKRRKRKKKLLPYYRIQPWLYDMYVTKDMTMAEVAEICNCSETAIRDWLIKFKIKIRPQISREGLEGRSAAWYRNKGRKAWEEYWRETPPPGYIVHHVDGDITNNSISNLALVTRASHNTIHKKGKKKQAPEFRQVEIPQHILGPTHVAA